MTSIFTGTGYHGLLQYIDLIQYGTLKLKMKEDVIGH